jgi:hypothetical protein
MTTTASTLITRVRTNVNEPTGQVDPLRTDVEILQWLEDAVHDYMSKVPVDAFPTLLAAATFSGSTCNFPTDFLKIVEVIVNHTISTSSSTSTTEITRAYALASDEGWLAANWGAIGAWVQFKAGSLVVGPSPIAGTMSYIKMPSSMSTTSSTFGLPAQHEEPIVNYATAMALGKINDTDAERYAGSYNARIAAERQKYGQPTQEPK